MSIFQRRLASSTYALLRSFERRLEKLDGLIEAIQSGRNSGGELGACPRNRLLILRIVMVFPPGRL
jgi:hypothetical protein